MDDLRYPIGQFHWNGAGSDSDRLQWIDQISRAPAELRAAVAGLTPDQIQTAYRPGGWTVQQVVHHVPESHLNGYIRFKLALTEDEPTIKPYNESRWAELRDVRIVQPETSLDLLETLHDRWLPLLRSLEPGEYRRTYRHPEYDRVFTLDHALAMYAWHGRHHIAHITALRERQGWE